MDETSARDARHGEEASEAQDLTSLLADETRRIQGDDSKRSQILQDETILSALRSGRNMTICPSSVL